MRAVDVDGTEAYFVLPEAEVEEMAAVEMRVVVVLVPGVNLDEEEVEVEVVGGGVDSDVAPFEA